MFERVEKKVKKKENTNEKKDTKIVGAKNTKGAKGIGAVVVLIVLLGLIFRLIGIQHGFPFIFHPDEPTIIRSALGVRFDPNPKHFDWPHFYIYLNYFLYMIFAKIRGLFTSFGMQNKLAELFPLMWDEDLIYYYLTRCFSAILGAFTAVPVFLATKELFGKKAGVLAALTMTILPYHVWHSHYALGDVPMAFLLAWAFYFSALIMKKPDRKNYILSGLFVGFSASVKYNGGLSAIMVPAAHFLRIFYERYKRHKLSAGENLGKNEKDFLEPKIIDKNGIINLVLSGIFALLGFLAGTPYALLDFKTFSRTDGPQGAFWQFTNVGSVGFETHVSKFFSESFGRVLVDTGYVVTPVYFLVLGFLIYRIVKKKTEREEFALSFVYIVSLFLLWYLSGFKNNRSHYYFVIYPYLAVTFGFSCAFLHNKIKSWASGWRGIGRRDGNKLFGSQFVSKILQSAFLVIIMSPLFVNSCVNAYKYHNNDTRVYLYDWLIENYDPAEKLIYNDKVLKDVFGKIGINGVKGLNNFDDYQKALVVIYEPGEDEEKFLKKNGSVLREVAFFDSKWKLGSDIVVYRYEGPTKSSGCGCGK